MEHTRGPLAPYRQFEPDGLKFERPDKKEVRRPLSGLGAVPPATWLRFRSVGDIVSAVAVIGILVLIIVWAQITASRRNLVLNSSSALGGFAQLNSAFAPVFSSYPPIHFDYSTRANSKAKFDRCDLQAFMRTLPSRSQRRRLRAVSRPGSRGK